MATFILARRKHLVISNNGVLLYYCKTTEIVSSIEKTTLPYFVPRDIRLLDALYRSENYIQFYLW